MKFCIVTRVFDDNLIYRENIIYEAIIRSGYVCDVYYADVLSRQATQKDINFIKCKKFIWFKDASISFSSKLIRGNYDVAIVSDVRQFFPLIFTVILKLKGVKIVYEHEQRSYGNSLFGILYTFFLVMPMLFVMVRISDIIRVPNLLCYRLIKDVRCNPRKLLFAPLAIRERIIKCREEKNDKFFRMVWTGKEANKKNIGLVIEAFLKSNIELSELIIVTNETIKYPIYSEKIKIINQLLTYDELLKLYKMVDVAVWTSPTQSIFDAASVGCNVICPQNNIFKNIDEYTNLINLSELNTDINGLADFSDYNIDKYKEIILKIKRRKIFNKEYYAFTGDKYLIKILNKINE
jgi:hypothetical protein